MPRYVSRPHRMATVEGGEWWPEGETRGTEVYVENEDAPTGLIDADGNMIWRIREPVGFIDLDEIVSEAIHHEGELMAKKCSKGGGKKR
jgi:hypothetical protein